MTLLKILLIIMLLIVALVFFTLHRNNANLFQAPGLYKRLAIYLTTNTAKTSDNPPLPELQTPVFKVGSERLYQRVLTVAAELDWKLLANDSDNQNANFEVRSSIFSFKDDVYVQVKYIKMNESSLYVQSNSRKGKADFAANAGHIQALINKIKQ